MKKQLASHAATKQCHIKKFSSFLARNCDALFVMKKVVWGVLSLVPYCTVVKHGWFSITHQFKYSICMSSVKDFLKPTLI